MNLPPGTRKHFNNPGDSTENSGAAAPNLLNVGPPIGDFNSIGDDFGGGGDQIESIFGNHQTTNFGEIHNFETNLNFALPGGDSFHHDVSSAGDNFHQEVHDSSFGNQHNEGLVPHHNTFDDHNEVQYGVPSHHGGGGGGNQHISTGYSDFAIGGFGPVKDDTILNSHHGGGGYKSHPNHHHQGYSSGYGHSSHSRPSFKPIHGPAVSGGHSIGSIPYGAPPAYGAPPSYGHSTKSYASRPVVIPIRQSYNRPHKGNSKGGYFKKFMGMFGY